MTLVEVLVAMTIFLMLGGALVMFLRVGVETWQIGEIRRETFERSQAILDAIADDLSSTFTNPAHGDGDLVEVRMLGDSDFLGRRRLRFVRTLAGEMRHNITQQAGRYSGGEADYDFMNDAMELDHGLLRAPGGLMEIAYFLDPDPAAEVLWRAVKSPIGGHGTLFDDSNIYEYAPGDGAVPLGTRRARPLAAGVLYLEFCYWGAHTLTWEVSGGADDGSMAQAWWDSTRAVLEPPSSWRGDAGYFDSNSLDDYRDDVFPACVRIVVVLRPARATRLARLAKSLGPTDSEVVVDRTDHYPEGAFQFIKIDGEWIRYGSKSSRRFESCVRGQRGTEAASHAAGAPVVYGSSFTRVVRIPAARALCGGGR